MKSVESAFPCCSLFFSTLSAVPVMAVISYTLNRAVCQTKKICMFLKKRLEKRGFSLMRRPESQTTLLLSGSEICLRFSPLILLRNYFILALFHGELGERNLGLGFCRSWDYRRRLLFFANSHCTRY